MCVCVFFITLFIYIFYLIYILFLRNPSFSSFMQRMRDDRVKHANIYSKISDFMQLLLLGIEEGRQL